MPKIIKDSVAVANSRSVRRRCGHSICGWPWFDIAFGPDADTGETSGRACGVLAMGDSAIGFIAVGLYARGFIAIGVAAFGVIAVGVCAVSLLFAAGVLAVSIQFSVGVMSMGWNAAGVVALGATAMGALAIGYEASGVLAIGYSADGVVAFGHDARGLTAYGAHVMDSGLSHSNDPKTGTVPDAARLIENHPVLRHFPDFLRSSNVLPYLWLLNIFWMVPLFHGLWLQTRRGWIFPKRSEVRVMYEGRGSGRSHKSKWTRFHTASGVLKILVTEDELWVWIPRYFPFLGTGVSYDLEHRIPARDISLITHNDATFFVQFAVDGVERKLELWPREPAKFLDAITSLP